MRHSKILSPSRRRSAVRQRLSAGTYQAPSVSIVMTLSPGPECRGRNRALTRERPSDCLVHDDGRSPARTVTCDVAACLELARGCRSTAACPPARIARAQPGRWSSATASPVAGLYSCSCQPSPNPYTTRPRAAHRTARCATRSVSGVDRQRAHSPRSAASARPADRDPQKEPGRDCQFRDRCGRPSSDEGAPRRGPPGELRPPTTSVDRLRRPPNPPSIGARPGPAALRAGDARGFGRQRPAFAEVPVGRVDRVPVHLVRPRAAEQHRGRSGQRYDARGAPWCDEREVARSGSATNQTGSRPPPFQYFTSSSHSCLRRRRQTLRQTAGTSRAHPLRSAAEDRTPAAGASPAPGASDRPAAARMSASIRNAGAAPSRVRDQRRAVPPRARRHDDGERRPTAAPAAAPPQPTNRARYATGTTSGSAYRVVTVS